MARGCCGVREAGIKFGGGGAHRTDNATGKLFVGVLLLQSVTGYLGVALVFPWGSTLRWGLVAIFWRFFASINFSFLRGGLVLAYHFMGFRHFPNI